MSERPKIVCLCGSSRFIEEISVRQWHWECQGVLALGMHLLPKGMGFAAHHAAEAEGVAHILDELHLRKIDMCDFVEVINPAGYIGERCAFEIEYAKKLGKPITYMLDPSLGLPNPAFNPRHSAH